MMKTTLRSTQWGPVLAACWFGVFFACVEAEEFFKEVEIRADAQRAHSHSKPENPASHPPANLESQTYESTQVLQLERGHSSISAFLHKATQGHEIEFGVFTASMFMRGDVPEKIEVIVHTPSLHADHPTLEQDIKSARVLRALRFPRAKFSSSTIEAISHHQSDRPSAAPRAYNVEGQLTVRGTSQLIRFRATLEAQPGSLLARAQVPIDLAHHGLHDARADNELVDRIVTLDMQLAFVKNSNSTDSP